MFIRMCKHILLYKARRHQPRQERPGYSVQHQDPVVCYNKGSNQLVNIGQPITDHYKLKGKIIFTCGELRDMRQERRDRSLILLLWHFVKFLYNWLTSIEMCKSIFEILFIPKYEGRGNQNVCFLQSGPTKYFDLLLLLLYICENR